ncbi:hypothetical protein [Psychroserpens sp. MEBiC05023]
MKEKIVKYKLFESPNNLNEIISSEINKNVFKKKYNLSGEYSNDGGIEIYNGISFITFQPNLGPLIKLNITCLNSNIDGTESILKLTRINGVTFYIQYWFSLIFTVITFTISLYLIIINGFDKIEIMFLPIIGTAYFFIIKLIANSSTDILISKIENILKTERIKNKKL